MTDERPTQSKRVEDLERAPSERPDSDPPARAAESRDRLEERIALLEAERDEVLNDLKRVAADFDNYKKRVVRDRDALVGRATEGLVKELLPVLDDLERALGAAATHEEAGGFAPDGARSGVVGGPSLEEGVALVERQLRGTLAKQGLIEIDTDGPFDPHVHEALLTQESEADEGTIIEVLQKGYRLGDRVLRPARVVISKGVQDTRAAE
jgi:molecular chaperone GrpE